MGSPAFYDISDWNNALAAILILVNSCLGIFFNSVIIYSFIVNHKQRTSFNVICLFRAINNVIPLILAFLGVFLPSIVIGHSIYTPIVETTLITISLNCNLFHSFQGFYFSFNRFFAIFFPVKYNRFFKIHWDVLFHAIVYSIQGYNVVSELVYRHEISKYLLFSVSNLGYSGFLQSSVDMYIVSAIYVGVPMAINFFTFLKYYHLKKSIVLDSEKQKQARKNMIQFLQVVLQDSLFSIHVVFNMALPGLINGRMWTFFCQLFVWQCLHVLDGFIMFMFNEKFSLLKGKLFSKVGPNQNGNRGSRST